MSDEIRKTNLDNGIFRKKVGKDEGKQMHMCIVMCMVATIDIFTFDGLRRIDKFRFSNTSPSIMVAMWNSQRSDDHRHRRHDKRYGYIPSHFRTNANVMIFIEFAKLLSPFFLNPCSLLKLSLS